MKIDVHHHFNPLILEGVTNLQAQELLKSVQTRIKKEGATDDFMMLLCDCEFYKNIGSGLNPATQKSLKKIVDFIKQHRLAWFSVAGCLYNHLIESHRLFQTYHDLHTLTNAELLAHITATVYANLEILMDT